MTRPPGHYGPRRYAARALSEAQIAVLQYIADGWRTKTIAAFRGVAATTVERSRAVICHRLDARTAAQAVAEGFRRGVLR